MPLVRVDFVPEHVSNETPVPTGSVPEDVENALSAEGLTVRPEDNPAHPKGRGAGLAQLLLIQPAQLTLIIDAADYVGHHLVDGFVGGAGACLFAKFLSAVTRIRKQRPSPTKVVVLVMIDYRTSLAVTLPDDEEAIDALATVALPSLTTSGPGAWAMHWDTERRCWCLEIR